MEPALSLEATLPRSAQITDKNLGPQPHEAPGGGPNPACHEWVQGTALLAAGLVRGSCKASQGLELGPEDPQEALAQIFH